MSLRVLRLLAVIWLALLSLGAKSMVLSQEQYLYRVWSVDAGLPQISVTAIVQDGEGFLWLGTQNGLARFDGLQFTTFNTANTTELTSNLITALFVDSKDRLWIGSVNGVVLHQNNTFARLTLPGPNAGAVTSFSENADGDIYIGGQRLYIWQDETTSASLVDAHQGEVYQLFRHQADIWIGGQNGFARINANGYQWFAAPAGLPELQVSELAVQGNDLYLGSNIGLFRWQRRQWLQLALPEPTENPRIEMLYLDPQQQLWVSSYDKLYRLQNGGLQAADFALGKQADFVWIESMLQDQHGNIWLGSHAHGLKRLRKPPTQRFSTAQGLQDPYVWAVQGWRQHLLVGTTSGLALLQHGQFQSLMANAYLPSQFVYSLMLDNEQRLWVGTRSGLSLLDGNTLAWQRNFDTISDLLVTTLIQEGQRIWVGTNGGLYFVEQGELSQQGLPEALAHAKVRSLLADSQQRLWIGTENGLFVRDDAGFHEVNDLPVSGRFISTITEFADGNILIGSFDYGFILGQPDHWRWLSQKDGLPGNGVLHVELIDGQLLISNFQGFYRVNYADLLVNKVTNLYMLVDDRRPEAATDSHRCCNGAGSSKGTVHQGRLWYPTLDGVISLPLQQLVQYSQVPDPVIQSVSADGERLRGKLVSLEPAQRDWHFRFTAPYFVQASSVMFRYRLKGYDDKWIDAGNRREAFYTNLPPGQYQFELQVRVAADYRWSDPVTMTLTLSPHWYETILARLLFVLVLLLTFWGLYRWRLLALAKTKRQLEQLVAERTQELHVANEKLQQMSMQDALTGLYNRHYLDVNIQQILSRANRHADPLIWALLDLDHFKRINDTFGHHTGDNILMVVADILRQNSRGSDHIIRWGGEEFLLVLEHNVEASMTLQRIFDAIAKYPWQRDMGLSQPLTCSIGAVTQMTDWNWQHSLRLADQALYLVKEHGRQGYLLLRAADPVPSAVLAEDANVVSLLAAGKLNAISNKDFTVIPS